MGNGESGSGGSKSQDALPFYTRDEDYGPLGEKTGIKCSLKNRLIGFGICCAIGWIVSLLGTLSLLFNHEVTKFAILYSIGQIISITGYPYHNQVRASWPPPRNKQKTCSKEAGSFSPAYI